MSSSVTRDDAVNAPPQTASSMNQPQALSAAQRQRAYRMRCKLAVTQAIGAEARASRVTLLALLGNELALLDDEPRESTRQVLRNSARRVLRILVTRYDIDLEED